MIDWQMAFGIAGISILFGLVIFLIVGWSQDRRWNDIHRRRMQRERLKSMEIERLLDDAVVVLDFYILGYSGEEQKYLTGTAHSFSMHDLGMDVLRKHKALRGELEEIV